MTVRTITLPINPGSITWNFFAWPSKDPGDSLPYSVDCGAWLADGALVLESVDVSVDAASGLTVDLPVTLGPVGANTPTLITLQISGGAAGTTGTVALGLRLFGGADSEAGYVLVNVALPIRTGVTGLQPVTPGGQSNSAILVLL